MLQMSCGFKIHMTEQRGYLIYPWQLQAAHIDFALEHNLIYRFEANASNVMWDFFQKILMTKKIPYPLVRIWDCLKRQKFLF